MKCLIFHRKRGNTSEKPLGFDIDIGTILKIKSMIEVAKEKSSPKIQLLNALKPFLNKSMQEKLEEYIKITYMITILEILSENRRRFFGNEKIKLLGV